MLKDIRLKKIHSFYISTERLAFEDFLGWLLTLVTLSRGYRIQRIGCGLGAWGIVGVELYIRLMRGYLRKVTVELIYQSPVSFRQMRC